MGRKEMGAAVLGAYLAVSPTGGAAKPVAETELAELAPQSEVKTSKADVGHTQEKAGAETRNIQADVRRAFEIIEKNGKDLTFESDGTKYTASVKKEIRGDQNVDSLTISTKGKDEESKYTDEGPDTTVDSADIRTKNGEYVIGRNTVFHMDGNKVITLNAGEAREIIDMATAGYNAAIAALLENADKGTK